MNDKKRRKRKHESDSSSANSEDEEKSRKTARKASESQVTKERRRKDSRHEKLKKIESSSTSDSSSESSDDSDHARKKRKRKEKDRARRKKEKRKRKREKKEKRRKRRKAREDEKAAVKSIDKDIAKNIDRTQGVETSREPQSAEPESEVVPKKRPMVPMTKEEYERQQAQVRRVYDPETGRNRLVKGTGEILEEIVSRDRHKAINKTATQGDGAFFQANLGLKDK